MTRIPKGPAVDTASAPAPKPKRALYRDGPPEITFAGRHWRRGAPQVVTDLEWSAILARADAGEYFFTLED